MWPSNRWRALVLSLLRGHEVSSSYSNERVSLGPLHGVRVVEMAGIGPVPFCGMLLSDLGASVTRVDRPSATVNRSSDPGFLGRGRRSVAVDLKSHDGVGIVLRLISSADVLIEGFRPGVMERLGLGPSVCQKRNQQLVYGRMTGWGQDGPLADQPGHDINYLALSGALAHLPPADAPPAPPLALLGDFGGGAMSLAVGVLAALWERQQSGRGQIIDASVVGAVALLTSYFRSPGKLGLRGTNVADGAAPFYNVYECGDARYISVGAVEPEFYSALCHELGLSDAEWGDQFDRSRWPIRTAHLRSLFLQQTRDEWVDKLGFAGACVAPVLDMSEAPHHAHNIARASFTQIDGALHPSPEPRFDRTASKIAGAVTLPGEDSTQILEDLGFSTAEIDRLRRHGVVA
jgi:alpha-methylacyl-CoA racemase